MKITKIFALLIICLSLFTLIGCDNNVENELNTDVIINNDELLEDITETYVTFEVHSESFGMVQMTEESQDGTSVINESASWDFETTGRKNLRDVLATNNISKIDPIFENDVFEGWVAFKEVITLDSEGYEEYNYEKISGENLYTTDEILEMVVPNHNIIFVAKCSSIPLESYIKESYSTRPIPDTTYFSLYANGGTLIFKDEETERFELERYNYWLNEGNTLGDVMTGNVVNSAILVSVEKKGAKFLGWTLYEADSLTWNSEETNDESLTYFLYDENDEDFKYMVLENSVLHSQNATTEDISQIVYNGKHYYAVANWE